MPFKYSKKVLARAHQNEYAAWIDSRPIKGILSIWPFHVAYIHIHNLYKESKIEIIFVWLWMEEKCVSVCVCVLSSARIGRKSKCDAVKFNYLIMVLMVVHFVQRHQLNLVMPGQPFRISKTHSHHIVWHRLFPIKRPNKRLAVRNATKVRLQQSRKKWYKNGLAVAINSKPKMLVFGRTGHKTNQMIC